MRGVSCARLASATAPAPAQEMNVSLVTRTTGAQNLISQVHVNKKLTMHFESIISNSVDHDCSSTIADVQRRVILRFALPFPPSRLVVVLARRFQCSACRCNCTRLPLGNKADWRHGRRNQPGLLVTRTSMSVSRWLSVSGSPAAALAEL